MKKRYREKGRERGKDIDFTKILTSIFLTAAAAAAAAVVVVVVVVVVTDRSTDTDPEPGTLSSTST